MRSAIRAFTVTALTCAVGALLALGAAPAWAASVFIVDGGGNGHGVGMSQYGAYGYALHGKGYQYILAHYYQGTALTTVNPSQTVRVLLQTGPASFSGATKADNKILKAGRTYSVQARADGSLILTGPSGKRIGPFSAPLTVSGPGLLTVAGRGTYRGELQFRPAGGNGVETINAIGLDDYVRGVVAAEMPSGWSAQALDAQAVAVRTYALTSDVGGSAYQLYPDTRSQEYGGVGAETAATNAAVAATRGQILTYHGAPATTYFFSSSGGYTEDVQDAFPGAMPESWLRGVPDPYDGAGGDPYHHWTYRLTAGAAAAKLRGLVNGSLVGIQVTEHGVSPRILAAQVVGTGGSTTTTGTALQGRFGLTSTLARFETIVTNPGTVAATVRKPAAGHNPDLTAITAETAASMSSLVHQVFAPRIPTVFGTVFPGSKGSQLLVQQLAGRRWHTVRKTQLGSGGTYSLKLPGAGTYRVAFAGLHGPTVSVG